MQYILTYDEYNELVRKKKVLEDQDKEELQKLCTQIADTMPIKFWGREEATPWGCMITVWKENRWEHYCDECPVKKICPQTSKNWSK